MCVDVCFHVSRVDTQERDCGSCGSSVFTTEGATQLLSDRVAAHSPPSFPAPSPIPVADFSIFTELPCTKWNLMTALTCISLMMAEDTGHRCVYLLPMCVSS